MITGKKIVLRDKKLADARDDYAWQTDPELTRLDAASQLAITFAHYLLDCTNELHSPDSIKRRFAIEALDGKHIGNCGYYSIDETKGEAELGVTIGNRDYWNKGYGTDVVTTLVDYIFRETNLDRIHLKTLDWNTRAHKCFQKCGFTPCGHSFRGKYSFILMEIHRKQWEKWQTET